MLKNTDRPEPGRYALTGTADGQVWGSAAGLDDGLPLDLFAEVLGVLMGGGMRVVLA
ncbi:hypothetical protein ACF07F_30005 [Streptomyces sp. NPDC015237]|uniref:hypothetical protein n=1 Tax=Streptomyces sp. NPDC015237 TaxID=3364949 RepID=UPI00370184A1